MTNAPRSKERGAGMSNSSEKKKRYNIPLWCKPNLSIEEAAAYSGIGMGKLYEMTESQDCPFVLWIGTIDEATAYTGIGRDKLYEMTSREKCPFVLWVGNRRMIKRRVFDEYIEKMYSI